MKKSFSYICHIQEKLLFSRLIVLTIILSTSGQLLMTIDANTEIEGSPYLSDDYLESAFFFNGNWYKPMELRFDVYENHFEVKLENGIYLLNPRKIGADTVKYNGEFYVAKDLQEGGSSRIAYVVLLKEFE